MNLYRQHDPRVARIFSAVMTALCAILFFEAREDLDVSIGCRTNDDILVSAGDTTRQHERRDRHGKLSGQYSHQPFVSFAVDRCCRHSQLQSSRTHT